MDVIVAIAVALTAFLAGLYGFLGKRASPRVDRGVCRGCGASVLAAAWRGAEEDASPRCSCGADLGRAGAMRLIGHEPSPRLARLGRIAAALACTIALVDIGFRATGRSWMTPLPAPLLGIVVARAPESIAIAGLLEVSRRLESHSLSAAAAERLLPSIEVRASGNSRSSHAAMRVQQLLIPIVLSDRERLRAVLGRVTLAYSDVAQAPRPDAPAESSPLWIIRSLYPSDASGMGLFPAVWIDSIEANGQPIESWQLTPPSGYSASRARRAFVRRSHLTVDLGPTPPPNSTLTLRVRFMLSPAWPWGAPDLGDPLFQGDTFPKELGLGEEVVETSVTIPLGTASPVVNP